jgi:hypothetical protein
MTKKRYCFCCRTAKPFLVREVVPLSRPKLQQNPVPINFERYPKDALGSAWPNYANKTSSAGYTMNYPIADEMAVPVCACVSTSILQPVGRRADETVSAFALHFDHPRAKLVRQCRTVSGRALRSRMATHSRHSCKIRGRCRAAAAVTAAAASTTAIASLLANVNAATFAIVLSR